MELQLIPTRDKVDFKKTTNIIEYSDIIFNKSPFIEANTKSVSLSHLKEKCIIPVFSKDNERTISHHEFIEVVCDVVNSIFPQNVISEPEIRVSHQIKGRVPTAINKAANELLEHEKTIYYERMAFIIRIPSITDTINGNRISLTLGGVRAYNQENLYSKKTIEKFKFFIGFQNQVCCNLCVSSDGFVDEIRVGSYSELRAKIATVIESYQAERHIKQMKELTQYKLTEKQFAQLIGRMRLYNYLPKEEKAIIPSLNLNDGQVSTIAKDFYQDERFCKDEDNTINLWNVYNLFTSANKSSYIDTFLGRNSNAFEFTQGLITVFNGSRIYHWFLG
ncbi:DUF3871 family protein [Tenacibaculum agarivorans]|uniref:DUF3871 family protein n=1 Tax=Tenacibaculum agarivorans TaxID=1908389 RepID=UPI00094BC5DB|nr:DUF3871 family protein [Tenacibaculum agarivorans]